ncbi:hypothetical protein GJ689_02695 [Rhodoplanes serenus]|uniref:TIGR03809 family protein n=1 Tax=Rhodoplanes serenus TaxID=200615 RepID=A0A9X4XJ49_9BRAD|nr:hypothetical protein [Rhodoplanes serenus]MTW15111.1 hypothetical protein [Rhodoplanes serenus]
MLAERRRAHLVELYRSGRWRRYFTEQELVLRMRDAVHEVEVWSTAAARWDGAPEGNRPGDEGITAGLPVASGLPVAEPADADPHPATTSVPTPAEPATQAGSPALLS